MQSFTKVDRFRGWTLTFLYAAMGLFSPLLAYATFRLWHAMEHVQFIAFFLVATCLLTAATSLKSLLTFFKTMRAGNKLPRLEVGPFFFMVVSLAIASRLFANL